MKKVTRIYLTLALLLCTAQFTHAQTELIDDGNFDNYNSTSWKYLDWAGLNTYAASAYSQPNSGIINYSVAYSTSNDGRIYQFITWPSNVLSATFQFYYHIVTTETTSWESNDVMWVEIIDNNGDSVVNLYPFPALSNTDANSWYTQYTYQLSPIDIYTISKMNQPFVSFLGFNNSTNPTRFNIDNVSLQVTVNTNAPIADFSVSDTLTNIDSVVQFTDQSQFLPNSWKWDFGDGLGFTTANYLNRNPTHTYKKSGVYSVKLTVTNDSGTSTKIKSNYITVNANSGISTNPSSETLLLKSYPNPVIDILHIDFVDKMQNQSFLFQIYDNVGKILISETIPAQTATYHRDISSLPNGLYCIRVINDDGNTITKNIIKE